MRKALLIFIPLLFACSAASIRGDEGDLPSPAQVQKLVDAGEYAPALRQLQRILGLGTTFGAAYDRYEMLLLRGECQLQVHQQAAALDSFAAAKKEAFARHKPDQAADPIAMIFLVRSSKAYQYVPKAAGGARSIPILDRARRGAAFGALLADELPSVEKKMGTLVNMTTVEPLLELAKSAGTLRAVEYAQTRDSKLMAPLTHEIAEKAQQLLDSAVVGAAPRVATISDAAQQLVIVPVSHMDPFTRHSYITQETRREGPSAGDTRYLQQVQALCEKVSTTANDFAEALDGEHEIMEAVTAKADVLKLRVRDILNDNYVALPNP